MRMGYNYGMERKTGEATQPLESSSTASNAATMEEVRQALRAELTKGLRSLGINPDFHRLHLGSPATDATSDSTTQSYSVIDVATSSSIPLTMSAPTIIPGSPISVANTPSAAGNVGTPLDFRIFHMPLMLNLHRKCSTQLSGNQSNLRVSLGVPWRASILGRPWLVIT